MHQKSWFTRFAKQVSHYSGHPIAFSGAMLAVILWGLSGPIFGFSDTWQLVINTSTTIITFLMVFLIQSTQNRDATATQIKLDELIRAVQGAHNALLNLEELEDKDLERLRSRYLQLAEKARVLLRSGQLDTDVDEVEEEDADRSDRPAEDDEWTGRA